MRRRFQQHSTSPCGPACPSSKQPVSKEAIADTLRRRQAEKVLHWAQMLRDEDPARVHSWLKAVDRDELEVLMCLALAAIPDGMTLSQAYGWVRRCL